MGQVIVTFGRINMGAPGGAAQLLEPNGARSNELSTSGTAASTTITAKDGEYAVVENPDSTLKWVRFNGTAAVSDGATVTHSHPVPALAMRAFGPLTAGATASVIDDS